jgi:hypothetical protein
MKFDFIFIIFNIFYYSFQEKIASATFNFPSICTSCEYESEDSKINYEFYITINCPNCVNSPLSNVPLNVNFTSPLINKDCGPISQNEIQHTYTCSVEINCSLYNINITVGNMNNDFISFVTNNLNQINLSHKKYINSKKTFPLQFLNWKNKKDVQFIYFFFNQFVTNNSETKVFIYNNTYNIIDLTKYCLIDEFYVICLPNKSILGADPKNPDFSFIYTLKFVDICGVYNPYVSVFVSKSNFFKLNNILIMFLILFFYL